MIYLGLALLAVLWVGRKIRPAHLGNDVLKFQIFHWLRIHNAREAAKDLKYETLERRAWLQISISIACVFACSSLSLRAMGLSWTSSLTTSLVPTLLSGIVLEKYSRTYRHITLPLFATLCRMPQSRWDMTQSPRMWVRVSPKKARVWIRLPRDWHANKKQLDVIQDLVATRLPGQWHMEADTRKFLLTFRQESAAETVVVPETKTPTAIEDELKFLVEEKETENGPW